MTSQKLLEELGTRFDKDSVRSIVAAYRNNPLLWKELSYHDLPDGWLEFADSQLEYWRPGLLSLAFIDPVFLINDFHDLNIPIPGELTDHATRVLETVRLTGLEPANLRDAASLAFMLRQYRVDHQSWDGLPSYMDEGKSSLSSWKLAMLSLSWLCSDADEALQAIALEESALTKEETADFLVDLVKSMLLSEKEQFNFLSQLLEEAPLELQVNVLGRLREDFGNSLLELLASSFLIQQNNREAEAETVNSQKAIENHQYLAMLSQYAGKPDKARQQLDGAIAVIKHNQANQLRRLALEFETINPEEARKLWEEILQLEPENSSHSREYAEFLVKQNEPDFALDLINQNPDEETTALLALRYPELCEQTNEVLEALDNVLSKRSLPTYQSRFSEISDNFKAADYAFNQKKYNLASDFIHKALKEKPNDIETIRLAAKIDQRLANLDEAIESSVLLATFEPENKENNKELARLYSQTQQDTKALEVYEKIIADENLVDREDFLNYSEIAIKAGKPELAIPIAENYLTKDKLDGEALVLLSRALIISGQKTEAVTLLERASAVAPKNQPAGFRSPAFGWNLAIRNRRNWLCEKQKQPCPENLRF